MTATALTGIGRSALCPRAPARRRLTRARWGGEKRTGFWTGTGACDVMPADGDAEPIRQPGEERRPRVTDRSRRRRTGAEGGREGERGHVTVGGGGEGGRHMRPKIAGIPWIEIGGRGRRGGRRGRSCHVPPRPPDSAGPLLSFPPLSNSDLDNVWLLAPLVRCGWWHPRRASRLLSASLRFALHCLLSSAARHRASHHRRAPIHRAAEQ